MEKRVRSVICIKDSCEIREYAVFLHSSLSLLRTNLGKQPHFACYKNRDILMMKIKNGLVTKAFVSGTQLSRLKMVMQGSVSYFSVLEVKIQ